MKEEPKDRGLQLHRWLQIIVSVGTTLTTAAVISGWGTWNALQEFMVRHEDVPANIKEISGEIQVIDGRLMQYGWRIEQLEKAKPRK